MRPDDRSYRQRSEAPNENRMGVKTHAAAGSALMRGGSLPPEDYHDKTGDTKHVTLNT